MRSIDTFDVKGWICFSITKLLRFFQHISKVTALFFHLSQNEVTGTVDDAGNPIDMVCRQAFTQCLNNRDAARNSCFKGNSDTLLLRSGKNLITVQCNQRFVCSDYMLTVLNRFHHQFFCW